MEASSSSNTANLIIESVVDNKSFDSVGGRKSEEVVAGLVEVSSDEVSSDELSEEEDYNVEEESDEEDSDEEDDEEEEEDNERARILEDLWKLKKLAEFFQHPEKPVEVDGFSAGRSYFSRPDAADEVTEDEDEERAEVLADALALKQSATAFLHPEEPVVIDAAACARNYFSQLWSSEQETFGQAEQRARLVEELFELKECVVTYRHPEAPFDLEPGTSMGRNYFLRASGPEKVDEEAMTILEEMKALKRLAVDYKHPERALEVDATASARNYFSRVSAEEQEDDEYVDEREVVLEEMKELKDAAVDFMHPERPVEIDALDTARSYFDCAFAPDHDAEEREAILQEMQALKRHAVDYMHPELPVEIDPAACGRNYFTRASAPEQLDGEEELILQEVKALKKSAVDYRHPEMSLEVDSTAAARNYFFRASAEYHEDDEYGDEREIVLEEIKELKAAATDFMHPERPVEIDAIASARSYFDRPSASDQDAEEREAILQDMQALKKLAVDYMHPELPVVVDSAACGRNYFTHPSAMEQEDEDYDDDRQLVLADAEELKQLATVYQHPENELEVDAGACARNYFSRPSAPEQDDEFERKMILQDAALLKQKAVDYMHPELSVEVDSAAFGRNYYGRASAPDQESFAEAEERFAVVSEANDLKQGAELYLHPEKPLEVDASVGGRNFFSRPSAYESDYDSDEGMDEKREQVLKEAAELKKLASAYMHPEAPLSVHPTAFGRNYLGRASAPTQDSLEEAEERSRVLVEAASFKKLAVDYTHPELPVDTRDAAVFGRNFFSRPAAADQDTKEEADERAQVLEDASVLKKLAVDYLHPEISVKTSDPTAVGRNYFGRASAAGATEHISTAGHANVSHKADEQSHHDDYGHFDMDEEMFYDIRQSIVVPLAGDAGMGLPKVQNSKISSDEEGELSRSPSSVMLFTGALEDADHPPLPTMG